MDTIKIRQQVRRSQTITKSDDELSKLYKNRLKFAKYDTFHFKFF